MPSYHVCFSGSLVCSGCNPCEACSYHVRSCVLPVAMVSAGFNQSLGQTEAFFNGYKIGWARLHDAMNADPELRSRFVARAVTSEQQEINFSEASPAPAPAVAAVSEETLPTLPTLNGAEPKTRIESLNLNGPLDLKLVKELLSEAEQKQNQRVKNMTKPMDPEEIAAAATPVVIDAMTEQEMTD